MNDRVYLTEKMQEKMNEAVERLREEFPGCEYMTRLTCWTDGDWSVEAAHHIDDEMKRVHHHYHNHDDKWKRREVDTSEVLNDE